MKNRPHLDTARDIRQVCREVSDLLVKKNRSYGDSALSPVQIFSRCDSTEGLRVRIDDKLSRLAHGPGGFQEDTLLDLLGYLVLLHIALKRGKNSCPDRRRLLECRT